MAFKICQESILDKSMVCYHHFDQGCIYDIINVSNFSNSGRILYCFFIYVLALKKLSPALITGHHRLLPSQRAKVITRPQTWHLP